MTLRKLMAAYFDGYQHTTPFLKTPDNFDRLRKHSSFLLIVTVRNDRFSFREIKLIVLYSMANGCFPISFRNKLLTEYRHLIMREYRRLEQYVRSSLGDT